MHAQGEEENGLKHRDARDVSGVVLEACAVLPYAFPAAVTDANGYELHACTYSHTSTKPYYYT